MSKRQSIPTVTIINHFEFEDTKEIKNQTDISCEELIKINDYWLVGFMQKLGYKRAEKND